MVSHPSPPRDSFLSITALDNYTLRFHIFISRINSDIVVIERMRDYPLPNHRFSAPKNSLEFVESHIGTRMAEMDGAELEFYDKMIARMIEEGQSGKNIALKVEDVSRILLKAKEIFLSQPSMLELASPIKILGDIHGYATPLLSPPLAMPSSPSGRKRC